MSAHSGTDPEFNEITPKPVPGRRFRFIEILVVLGIIGLLVAFLIPVNRSAPRAARRSQCVNNLRQIGLALNGYEQTYHCLPPAYTVDSQGRPLHSWRTLILPYLEQDALYRTIDLSKPWNDPANAKVLETPPTVFHCPASLAAKNTTTYLAIVAPDGCFLPDKSRRLAEITDAHASTLMVIEAGEKNAVPWMAPTDANESLVMGVEPGSTLVHSGGVNACFVDGSVRFLRAITPANVRRALISISGNDDDIAAGAN